MSTAISVLGGVGLFLLGMTVMTGGLKALAGSALRTVLGKAAATPLRGSFWGSLVTLLVQSSSATTMTTIGLVSAGLPTFAPKTRPRPCGNVSKPALTRPIVVMVVALDDWTRSVTSAPQKEPRSGVAAALLSTVRSAEPANAFRPSVMTVMPRRKRPMPPITEIAVDMRAPQSERRLGYLLTVAQLRCESSRSALPHRGFRAHDLLPFSVESRTRCLQFLPLLRVDRRISEVELFYGF